MAGPIKAVLVAIIASAALFLLTHLAFFFPFYITIVAETFNLANIAANDNYVRHEYWTESLEGLRDRPIFSKAYLWNDNNISIEVIKGVPSSADGKKCENICAAGNSCNGRCAVGYNGAYASAYFYDENGWADRAKPYRQRGEPVTVTVRAVYPFEVSMWGWTIRQEWPVSYHITTIGLRYYKDLPYDDLFGR